MPAGLLGFAAISEFSPSPKLISLIAVASVEPISRAEVRVRPTREGKTPEILAFARCPHRGDSKIRDRVPVGSAFSLRVPANISESELWLP